MRLSLAISPCPNDTFMFDAMINGRIDTEGLEFDVTFADIEELNTRITTSNAPQICKVSYAMVPSIADKYRVLSCGSALGSGNGPLLVTANDSADITDFDMRIAIPGENTTANLLMSKLHPHLSDKTPYLFSDILGAVVEGEVDAGVLIHEGRFVYRKHGLYLLSDLGIEWNRRTGLPLPLGAITVSRELPVEIQQTVDRVLRRSIEYGLANPRESMDFVRSHAQELDDAVIKSHIDLFVNDFSLDIGDSGRRAIHLLLDFMDKELFVSQQ